MDAVNSQGFTRDSPPLPFYECHNEMCMSAAVFVAIKLFEYQPSAFVAVILIKNKLQVPVTDRQKNIFRRVDMALF